MMTLLAQLSELTWKKSILSVFTRYPTFIEIHYACYKLQHHHLGSTCCKDGRKYSFRGSDYWYRLSKYIQSISV